MLKPIFLLVWRPCRRSRRNHSGRPCQWDVRGSRWRWPPALSSSRARIQGICLARSCIPMEETLWRKSCLAKHGSYDYGILCMLRVRCMSFLVRWATYHYLSRSCRFSFLSLTRPTINGESPPPPQLQAVPVVCYYLRDLSKNSKVHRGIGDKGSVNRGRRLAWVKARCFGCFRFDSLSHLTTIPDQAGHGRYGIRCTSCKSH